MKELCIAIPEGKVHVNKKRLKEEKYKGKKFKLKKVAVILTLVAALTVAGIFGYKAVEPKLNRKPISPIPENKIEIMLPVEVGFGDTLSDIVDRCYNEDNAGVFNSTDNYADAIISENNLHYGRSADIVRVERGDKLNIPFIIGKDNILHLKMLELEEKMAEIKRNNYWVKYTVQKGDTLSGLASLASRNETETYNNLEMIMRRNGISSSEIHDGDKIFIINPEYGKYLIEYDGIIFELEEELINNQKAETGEKKM